MLAESQPSHRNIALRPPLKGLFLLGEKRLEVVRNAKAPNLVGAELVRLATGWNLDNPGRERGNEARSDSRSSSSSNLVAVQHQNDFMKVPSEKPFLVRRQRTPHQRDDAGQACLMHLEAIEKAFHNNDGPAMLDGPVKVKEHKRLSKQRRELVLRLGLRQRPPGIGNQDFILIVNRDNDSALHTPIARKESDAKVFGRFFRDPSVAEVRV